MADDDGDGPVHVSCCSEITEPLARILAQLADALRRGDTQRDYLLVGWDAGDAP